MESKDAILKINDWENQRKGLLYGALAVGVVGLAAGLSVVDIIPTIKGAEETLKTVFVTSIVMEAPILSIRESIEHNARLFRKILGRDKEGNPVATNNSNRDCAIYEINKREDKKSGLKEGAILTGLISGIAALGMFYSNKEEMPKILEIISKTGEEFKVAFIASASAIVLSIMSYIKKCIEINLIKKSFGVNNDDVWEYNVNKGERGAKKKSLFGWVGDKIRNIKSKKKG
jgi:hypothetical protein